MLGITILNVINCYLSNKFTFLRVLRKKWNCMNINRKKKLNKFKYFKSQNIFKIILCLDIGYIHLQKTFLDYGYCLFNYYNKKQNRFY